MVSIESLRDDLENVHLSPPSKEVLQGGESSSEANHGIELMSPCVTMRNMSTREMIVNTIVGIAFISAGDRSFNKNTIHT